jgi:hypothetical protein
MPNTLAQKLKIKEGFCLLTIHAPSNFQDHLQPLPADVTVSANAKNFQQVHWFVNNKAQLEMELDTVMKLVKGDVLCWIYYPKGTSQIQTDLTRDKGWDKLLAHEDLQWISLISFDETWSTFAFRMKTEADRKKDEKPKAREIFNYIDTEKKEIRLPDDLAAALKEHKQQDQFFQSLSFTNRKEFVEWIVMAKREDTRRQRIAGTIERLEKLWKNPRNM